MTPHPSPALSTALRQALILVVAALCVPACTSDEAPDPEGEETPAGPGPLPEFVDDCDEGSNDEAPWWSGVTADDGWMKEDVRLCAGDIDLYRVDIPAGRWLSVEVRIDGAGTSVDRTDFDLYELSEAGFEESPSESAIWWSASEEPYERLAWFNNGSADLIRYFAVDPYLNSEGTYDLIVDRTTFHTDRDCDDAYPDEDASDDGGPCNRILQAPQANSDDDGFLVTHEAHYSNLRREVLYLVRWAAAETRARWPDEAPLALMDMSERDGSTPGSMVNSLRHPEGTHVDGNDIDIAYYQNGDDNLGRAVCPNDQYFCTGDPEDLDPRRTAYFTAKLMRSDHIRVIGMDPLIAEAVQEAGDELHDEGEIDDSSWQKLYSQIASGDGWPFHHHHMHLSWTWESGHERSTPPEGCASGPGLYPDARR